MRTPDHSEPVSEGLGSSSARLSSLALLATLGGQLEGCVTNNYVTNVYETSPDTGSELAPEDEVEEVGSSSGSSHEANTDAENLRDIDLFDTDGHRFYLEVSDEQLELMNENFNNSYQYYGPWNYYGTEVEPTFVDHMVLSDASTGEVGDFEEVEVELRGQSSGREWSGNSLASFHVDMDEATLDGQEHFKLNSGMAASIFRESITNDILGRMDIPVARTGFVWVESNVWGEDEAYPYTLVESYKQEFCDTNKELIGGDCINMWESTGDITSDNIGWIASQCQLGDSCDNTRLYELADTLSASYGSDFMSLTEDWIDWDAVHTMQCADWALQIGDDYFHNYNNVVIVERDDGRFLLLPYSTDISLGMEGYTNVKIEGWAMLSQGCEQDTNCRDHLAATCEEMMDEYITMDPLAIAQSYHDRLESLGMLREGDDDTFEQIRESIELRLQRLPVELTRYVEQRI